MRKPLQDRSLLVNAGGLILPVLLHLLLQLETIHHWWSRDDPCILASIARHGIRGHFLDGATWRSFSGTFFVPWQLASLGADYHLAGLQPVWFFVHQLASGVLLLCLAYLTLRRFVSAGQSCLTLCLVVSGAPFFAVARQLMNRHYLEGLLWLTLAFLLFQISLDRNNLVAKAAGAFFFLLAALSKEIFIPLLLLFPLFCGGRRKECRQALSWYGAGLLIYLAWRFRMLGLPGLNQAYAEPASLPSPHLLGLAAPALLSLWLLIAGATGLILWSRTRRAFWILAVSLSVATVTLLPVLGTLQPRHLLLPVTMGSIATAHALWSCKISPFRKTAVSAAVVLFQLVILPRSSAWKFAEELPIYRSEGEFLLTADSSARLLTASPHTHFLACLEAFRKTPPAPSFCGDPCWCRRNLEPAPEFEIVDGEAVRFASSTAESCAREQDLDVVLKLEEAEIEWEFGPYTASDGSYSVILLFGDSASVPAPVRQRGRMPLGTGQSLHLVVRFDSKAGWTTYSEVLEIGPEGGTLHWNR